MPAILKMFKSKVWAQDVFLIHFSFLNNLLQLEQLEREMDKLYVLTMPLGKDRFHNRFWFFNREGRLFVESEDSSRWGYYAAKEEVRLFASRSSLSLGIDP